MKVERRTTRAYRSDNGTLYETLEAAKHADMRFLLDSLGYDLGPIEDFLIQAITDDRLILILKRAPQRGLI